MGRLIYNKQLFTITESKKKLSVLFGTKFSGKFTVHKFHFKQQCLSQKRVHKNRVDLKLGGVASVNGCTTYCQTKVEIISLNPGFLSYKTITPALPIIHIFLRLRCLWKNFINCKQRYKFRISCCCCLCLVACECVKLALSAPDMMWHGGQMFSFPHVTLRGNWVFSLQHDIGVSHYWPKAVGETTLKQQSHLFPKKSGQLKWSQQSVAL